MVAAWPFPCLHVGMLMKTPNLKTFQAVLDGVDMHLKREFHYGSEKLQVLDLRNVHHEFLNIWTGREDGAWSAETVDERPVVKDLPRYALRRRHVKVITDLYLRFHLNEEQACFLQWVQQRKDFLKLHYMNIKIWTVPMCTVKEILNVFHPGHIEDLELNLAWDVSKMAQFASCLGKMRSLRKLFLKNKAPNTFRPHKQILWSLTTCLETLSIKNCEMSSSDLKYFPLSHSLHQLKQLDLRGSEFVTSCLKPLGVLLENVAGTLESLDLQGCNMDDSQLTDLIPALSKCSQLTEVNFSYNDFSMPVLKDLLHHTANLIKMSVEYYPAPLQCYNVSGYIEEDRYAQLCHELMDILRAIREPCSIFFSTNACHVCNENCDSEEYSENECCVFHLELCSCWQ
ncbi:preferentially expressed antigen in melanoma-like protein 7 [Peromyscus maniculatus bairdii]|uniref:preferentially expressed antigen in melanoma-like protein 7 n=1 Tax=Peromyscus maniculatus bairdii TaxID=230844 RepID=UPI003FD25583